MSKYLYNGVELPALPEWDKKVYPYAFIYIVTLDGTTGVHTLVVSSSSVMGYDGNGIICPSATVGKRYTVSEDGWATASASDDFYIKRDNLIYTVWANFDVLNSDGSVYVAASDPVPVAGKFPLRGWVGWLLAGLCSRAVPVVETREPVAYLYKVDPVTEDVPIGNIALGYTMVDPTSGDFDPYLDVVKGTNLLDRFDFSSLRKESKGWNLFYNYYAPAEGYKEIRFTIGAYYSANYPNMDTIQLILGHTANGETSSVTDTTLYFSEKDISPFELYVVAYWQGGRPVSYFLLALPYDKTMYNAGLCLGKPKTTVFPFAEVAT